MLKTYLLTIKLKLFNNIILFIFKVTPFKELLGNSYHNKFKGNLVKGKCYLVQHFHVLENIGYYHYAKHSYCMGFNKSIVIQ